MLESQPYDRRDGHSALVVSLPTGGLDVPAPIAARMTRTALTSRDAAWHIHRLVDGLIRYDASIIQARYSRYLADPTGDPAAADTRAREPGITICPTLTCDGQALYRTEHAPDAGEAALRRVVYWQPYHDAVDNMVRAASERAGSAVLLEIHSRASPRMPKAFDIGTAGGASCSPLIRRTVEAALTDSVRYDYTVDGLDRTSQTLIQHGRPFSGVHAVAVTIAQNLYMYESSPYPMDEGSAHRLRGLLTSLGQRLQAAAQKVGRIG